MQPYGLGYLPFPFQQQSMNQNMNPVSPMKPINTMNPMSQVNPMNQANSMSPTNAIQPMSLGNSIPQVSTTFPTTMSSPTYRGNYNLCMNGFQQNNQKNNYPVEEIEKMYPKVYYRIYPKVCKYCDMFRYNYGFRFMPNTEQLEAICDEIYNEVDTEINSNSNRLYTSSDDPQAKVSLEEQREKSAGEAINKEEAGIKNSEESQENSEEVMPVVRTMDSRRDFDRGDRFYNERTSRRADRRVHRNRRRHEDIYGGDFLEDLIKIILINRLIKNY